MVDMRTSVAGFLGLVAGAVLGAAGATILAVDSGPRVPAARRSVGEPPVVLERGETETQGVRADGLSDCWSRLALAEGLLESCRLEVVGEPVPFPDGLAPRFRPENFEAAVRESLAECPDVDVQLREVDCEEYPCIAWMVRGPEPAGTLRGCDAWQKAFGGPHGSLMFSVPTEERTVRVHGLAPADPAMPDPDDVTRANGEKRWTNRTDTTRERLFDELGGLELSEEETLRRSIAIEERVLEDAASTDARRRSAEWQLPRLRERLDALHDQEGDQ